MTTTRVHPRAPQKRRVRQLHVLAVVVMALVFTGLGAYVLVVGGDVTSVIVGIVMMLFGIALTIFPVWLNRVERVEHRRRCEALVAARQHAPPATAIADGSGHCRIVGKVHIRSSASGAPSDTAAYLRRTIKQTELQGDTPRSGKSKVTDLLEERSCGRFAVVDDSGVAIVDPEVFELLSRDELDPFVAATVTVRHGDKVEIIGTARRGRADDADELFGEVGYREAAREVLLFDDDESPVIIVPRRLD